MVVYCNDCLITRRAKAVADIKAGISKQVKIEDLGKLSRHLGVDYKFGHDEHGPCIWSSMNEYHESMIRDFEKDIGNSLETFSTPGAAVTPSLRSTPEDEIILNEEYRSYVGRIMFACGKTEPTLSNACRELTSHLTAPNKEHWTALGHLMGYMKQGTNLGIKMRVERLRIHVWLRLSIRTMLRIETTGKVFRDICDDWRMPCLVAVQETDRCDIVLDGSRICRNEYGCYGDQVYCVPSDGNGQWPSGNAKYPTRG